jgi:hypothetical protein
VNETWLDDYYARWLYDQDLIDLANDELNLINETKETE